MRSPLTSILLLAETVVAFDHAFGRLLLITNVSLEEGESAARAAGEVRVAMTRNGGNMADPGSVSYLFSRKGVVILEKNGLTEDDVLLAVLEAGAEEVNDLGDSFEVICEPTDLVAVRTALRDAGIDYDSAEASFQPSVTVPVDLEAARKVLKLVDALEDSDDVQDVYTNIDLPDDVAAQLDED